MSETDISKMNFKELRNEVLLLRDELAIFKRKYEDAIYNLDYDNFGKSFTVEQNNMKSQIKITADAIKTMVSYTDLDSTLEEYSTISQTAQQIQTAVVSINNATDKKLENYSTVKQTAEAITTKVTANYITNLIDGEYQTVDDATSEYNAMWSEINQTADSLSSIVSKNISAYFEKSVKPTASNTTAVEKSMLCLYGGTYYYFNDVTNTWKTYPASGITTMFEQTASGFSLIGDVSISGDLITSGTIKGLTVGTNPNIYGDGVRLNTDTQRLEIMYNGVVVGAWGPTSIPGGSSIYPAGGGTLTISGVSASGTWDFSGCEEVIGLPSTVAVFG